MDQCDLFITRNGKRDLNCIKSCDCKASKAQPMDTACIFVVHKSKHNVGGPIENRSLTTSEAYPAFAICFIYCTQWN